MVVLVPKTPTGKHLLYYFQEEAVTRAREREAEGIIRQCNEGKLAFHFEETRERGREGRRGGGDITLEISVPRYLDSSLIDVNVDPHYVSVVIKGKVGLPCPQVFW